MTGKDTSGYQARLANLCTPRSNRREFIQQLGLLGLGSSLGSWAATSVAPQRVLAQSEKEIVIAAGGDIDTTDPHVSQLLLFNNMMRFTVFNSLVRYGPDLSYVGELAESWENPDDKTYVFKLRQGVTYHNGQDVEASHIEFSYKRIAEKQTVWSSRVANIESFEVLDPLTIKISLTQVQADFLDGLVPLSIISPEIAGEIETKAVGSGPFRFVEWVPNDHITLERNPSYFEPGVPGIDRVTFRIVPEAQVAITNLKARAVNAVMDVPISQAVPLKSDPDIQVMIVPTSSIHLFELLGKNNEAIRTNVKVRQAIAHCLDKDAVQQTVFSGEGRQKWTFVGSTHWAFRDLPGYDYDPEKAKALLAEAGISNLEFTCLTIQGYPDGEKAATIWQAGLAEAGIKMNIEVQELGVWLDNYINHTYDVIWNVFPGFADPNYFVGLGLKPHLEDGWTNPEAAELADAANQTLDQVQRAELYGRLQELFVAELPILVIQEAPQASLLAPNVAGWEINPLGYVFVKNVTLG